MEKNIRFLLVRDDIYHQRGYWIIANSLKNEGIEVVIGGVQTPKGIVQTALQEDVDIIGYRIMQAAPTILIQSLFDNMKEKHVEDIVVVVGGIIPEKDEIEIKRMGVKEVFRPFSPVKVIVERIKNLSLETT